MYASVTTGHTASEIRPTRIVMRNVGTGPEQSDGRRTVRVAPARSNARRTAIRESLATAR